MNIFTLSHERERERESISMAEGKGLGICDAKVLSKGYEHACVLKISIVNVKFKRFGLP